MGIGKILGYTILGAGVGVAAVAAAPFTGGGSLLGAATLATSLAGAGTIAAATGAAAVAGGAGAYLANKENEDDEKKKKEIEDLQKDNADLLVANQKLMEAYEKTLLTLKNDKVFFNFILGMVGLGIAMANADGHISDKEQQEIDDFANGMASSSYPQDIKDIINDFYHNPPSLGIIMDKYISKIDPVNYNTLRCLLEVTMHADGEIHEREKYFMEQFEKELISIRYNPESNDEDSDLLEKN